MAQKEAKMNKEIKEQRRSLIKGAFLAGAAALLGKGAKDAVAKEKAISEDNKEILYRETPEFKAYYESLRD